VASPGVSPDLLWQRASRWSFVLWIPALVLAVRAGRLGGRRSGWWAAAVSLVPTAVAMVRAAGSPTVSAWEWVSVLIDVAVVAGLATSAMADAHPKDAHPTDPHPTDADPTGARPWDWIIVAAAAVVVWEVATVVLMVASPTWSRVPDWLTAVMGATVPDNLALWTFALLVVGATLLARAARGTRVGTERVLALALVAAVISLLRTGSLLDWTPLLSGSWTAGMASVTVGLSCQLLLSLAVAVTAGVVAARRIRRLPAVHYSYADPAGPRATA
jgi:hypothetical protein